MLSMTWETHGSTLHYAELCFLLHSRMFILDDLLSILSHIYLYLSFIFPDAGLKEELTFIFSEYFLQLFIICLR